jgi:hypothetical protein
VELEGLEKVYVFDQAQRPPDNGVAGTSYTAEVYVVNEQNGSVNGPYEGSSYPNSISSSNNATSYNTLKTGEHLFNNESGHLGSSKQGLNIVNANGERKASGTDPSGNDVTMTLVNFHVGTSDNGGPQSRGSAGCLTISPADGNGFMSNFDWSGSKTVVNSQGQQVTYSGTTGVSTGSITVHRGDTQASKLDKLKIELLNVTINSLNEKADNGSKQN